MYWVSEVGPLQNEGDISVVAPEKSEEVALEFERQFGRDDCPAYTVVPLQSNILPDFVKPKVREMDENEWMDPDAINRNFEQRLIGVETFTALRRLEFPVHLLSSQLRNLQELILLFLRSKRSLVNS
ncbi:hypothetical protein EV360DRAFT_75796 [Lentinula raphanica]|nr:hypothetical protein EV360DRAFT_75796 [Lentinula raphanica]